MQATCYNVLMQEIPSERHGKAGSPSCQHRSFPSLEVVTILSASLQMVFPQTGSQRKLSFHHTLLLWALVIRMRRGRMH